MHTVLTLISLAVAPPPSPRAARPLPVEVIVDTSDAPDAAPWAATAAALVRKWHPIISRMLPSDGYRPPSQVRLVFRKDMKGVAFASGRTITISARWIEQHPEDFGMVVHELTHVIQGYRRGGPSWLVEGIADYVRFAHYEPHTPIRVDPKKASYRDGYRTTAKFLNWVEGKYDRNLVRKLNHSLRTGKYRKELFEECTSKTLDQLWDDFLAAQERK